MVKIINLVFLSHFICISLSRHVYNLFINNTLFLVYPGLPELPTGIEDDTVVQDKVQSILEMGHKLAKEGKAQGDSLTHTISPCIS